MPRRSLPNLPSSNAPPKTRQRGTGGKRVLPKPPAKKRADTPPLEEDEVSGGVDWGDIDREVKRKIVKRRKRSKARLTAREAELDEMNLALDEALAHGRRTIDDLNDERSMWSSRADDIEGELMAMSEARAAEAREMELEQAERAAKSRAMAVAADSLGGGAEWDDEDDSFFFDASQYRAQQLSMRDVGSNRFDAAMLAQWLA
jgi:hypothetical protein